MLPAPGGFANQPVELVPGAIYELAATGMLESEGASGQIGIRYTDPRDTSRYAIKQSVITFTETSYVVKTATFVVPKTIAGAEVVILTQSGDGSFVIDAISLRAQGEPIED